MARAKKKVYLSPRFGRKMNMDMMMALDGRNFIQGGKKKDTTDPTPEFGRRMKWYITSTPLSNNPLQGGKKEKKKKDMKAMVSRRRDARGKASGDEASRGYPGAQVDVSQYVYGEGRNFSSGDGSALQIAQLAYADNDDADALYYYNGVLKKAFFDRGAVATSNASAGHVATITGKSNATIGLTQGT